jgi:hypothetical protein
VDYWFYNQFLTSPRRVHDPKDCDVVVVPFGPHASQVNTTFRHFMERADKLLPLLASKPHILVLNLPAFMYEWIAKGVMDIPGVRKFTIITAEVGRRRLAQARARGSLLACANAAAPFAAGALQQQPGQLRSPRGEGRCCRPAVHCRFSALVWLAIKLRAPLPTGGCPLAPQMTPNLMQVHWHAGHHLMPGISKFKPAAVEQHKRWVGPALDASAPAGHLLRASWWHRCTRSLLAMSSGIVRVYPLRFRLHKDCTARPHHCKHINWTTHQESLEHVGAAAMPEQLV